VSDQLTINGGRDVEQFNPERHRLRVAALDYGIEEAKRLKDWPALEQAVHAKIDEQIKFVAWWDANIAHGGGSKNRERGSYSLSQAEDLTGMKQQRVSDLGKRLADREKYHARLLGAAYQTAMLEAGNVRGTQGTGENEWYTPEKYIVLARKVLSEIDLDPASHAIAQRTIQAANFFTQADDGLKQEWHGRVWLNPPYEQPLIADFVSKLLAEVDAGRTTAAIMLTHNYTDTSWFQKAGMIADAICFTRGRIKFYKPDGTTIAAPTQGQAFCYFGDSAPLFVATFAPIGLVR
jgi:phage N-6-adenine-methyltransferase